MATKSARNIPPVKASKSTLLMEYFYNDGERLHSILGDGFIDKHSFQVKNSLDNESFKNALKAIQ